MRKVSEKSLVIATHNEGKAQEIAALLGGYVDEFDTSGALGLSEPVEDGDTFVANALIKAKTAAAESGRLVLADDSGLVVNALGGDPGIYSARWAGDRKNFDMAMDLVNKKLADATDRSAYFVCVLALAWPDGHSEVFEGRVYGTISSEPRGKKGFGYDPIFVADGYDITFAEMEPEAKHTISHRADAFSQLVAACF